MGTGTELQRKPGVIQPCGGGEMPRCTVSTSDGIARAGLVSTLGLPAVYAPIPGPAPRTPRAAPGTCLLPCRAPRGLAAPVLLQPLSGVACSAAGGRAALALQTSGPHTVSCTPAPARGASGDAGGLYRAGPGAHPEPDSVPWRSIPLRLEAAWPRPQPDPCRGLGSRVNPSTCPEVRVPPARRGDSGSLRSTGRLGQPAGRSGGLGVCGGRPAVPQRLSTSKPRRPAAAKRPSPPADAAGAPTARASGAAAGPAGSCSPQPASAGRARPARTTLPGGPAAAPRR